MGGQVQNVSYENKLSFFFQNNKTQFLSMKGFCTKPRFHNEVTGT